MGEEPAGRIALLSIHPKYADAIFDGTKRVEFRRSRFSQDVTTVVVYATRPVGSIVGWFEVDTVVEGTPRSLWRRFSSCAGIDRAAYLKYFDQAPRAFGITVSRAVRFDSPKRLADLRPGIRPPQSFQYLGGDALTVLMPGA